MTLGEAVHNYRQEHGLTMNEFAKLCQMSKGYISMLEKNKNPRNGKPIVPSIATYSNIATAMNIKVDDLMRMIDKDQPVSLPAPPSTDSEYIEKYKALKPEHKAAVNNQIDFFSGIEQDDEEQEGGSA